jgi:hypothetical protein
MDPKRVSYKNNFKIGRYEILLSGTIAECLCRKQACQGVDFRGRIEVSNGGHIIGTHENTRVWDPLYFLELANKSIVGEVVNRYVLRSLEKDISIGYGEHHETRM